MAVVMDEEPPFDETVVCNRCGECCQRFYMPNPLEIIGENGWQWSNYDREWFEQLTFLGPAEANEGKWRYRCNYFKQEEDGTGTCTIYDSRPGICREFPYGKWINGFENCVWSLEKQLTKAVSDCELSKSREKE